MKDIIPGKKPFYPMVGIWENNYQVIKVNTPLAGLDLHFITVLQCNTCYSNSLFELFFHLTDHA